MINLYLSLNLLLFFFSAAGVLAKLASGYSFLSIYFLVLYGAEIVVLVLYAIAWQQIIKRIALSNAYACRAILIIWGCIWGHIIFQEQLSVGKLLGCFLVICGVILYSLSSNNPHENVQNKVRKQTS